MKIFEYEVIDINGFPLIINARHIYCAIVYYKRYGKSCIAGMSEISCYYRLFISSLSLVIVLRSDLMVVAILDKEATNMIFFNYCS